MRGTIVAVITLAAFGWTTSSATAQWLYQGNESEFGDAGLHMAITGKGEFGFGVRCQGSTVEAVYMTPDTSMQNSYEQANKTLPKLKLRVDKGEIIELDTQFLDSDGKLLALSTIDTDFLISLKKAKKSVAVTISLIGQNFHENSFSVRGSTKAIDQMLSGCGIDSAESEGND